MRQEVFDAGNKNEAEKRDLRSYLAFRYYLRVLGLRVELF